MSIGEEWLVLEASLSCVSAGMQTCRYRLFELIVAPTQMMVRTSAFAAIYISFGIGKEMQNCKMVREIA